MTYEEIIAQVARRVGYSGYENVLKRDLKMAVNWSEGELLTETGITKNSTEIILKSDTIQYSAPADFGAPWEYIVIGENGEELQHEEVAWDVWTRWNPLTSEDISSNELLEDTSNLAKVDEVYRFTGKIVLSLTHSTSGYIFGIKPAINGKLQVLYTVTPVDDIFTNVKLSPVIPTEMHKYIVSGAVMYLAEIEAGLAIGKADYVRAEAMHKVFLVAKNEWEQKKRKAKSASEKQSKPGFIRAFTWYDDPRKYSK